MMQPLLLLLLLLLLPCGGGQGPCLQPHPHSHVLQRPTTPTLLLLQGPGL